MQQPELNIQRARGFLLIVAILVLVVIAVAIAALGNMTSADVRSSSQHAQSEQAYFAATSGLEYATRLLKSGTACGALPTAATAVGLASVTLSRTLNNPVATTVGGAGVATTTQTTIPATSTAGYAAHGRIVIDGEQIRYTGITATSFTGATRGYGGTTAATHLAAATVLQNQCSVQATGTSGVATRVMQSAIQNGLWSEFLDDSSTAVPTVAVGTLHTLNAGSGLVTSLPAGNNIVIAIVALRNIGAISTIATGNLRLRNVTTATTLASNLYGIDVGGVGAPTNNLFDQKTFFFVHREIGAAANQTYRIEGQATAAGVNAEVKIMVINGPPVSSSQTTQSNNAGNAPAFATILTHTPAPPYPPGDNIVIAAVQWNNNSGANRAIAATDLQLVRSGGATLASNTFAINIRTNAAANANDNGGMLLVGREANAAANPTYVVQARANGLNLQVEAKLIVISAVGSAYLPGGVSIPLNASPTSLGTLSTGFPALRLGAANIAVAATQYATGNTARSINATNEDLVFGGSPQTWNEFQMDLCANVLTSPRCADFAMGLMGRQTITDASPSFSVQTSPSSTAVNVLNGEAKILGMHLSPVTDRFEVIP